MSDYLTELLTKKNLINILILAILVLAVPLTINLVRRQQILFSKAATDTVQLVDNPCTAVQNGKKVLTCPTVKLNFVAPSEVDVIADQSIIRTAYAQTGSTCPTRPLQDIGNEELIAKCTLAEIALLSNDRLQTFPLSTIALLPNDRLMQMSLEFLAKLPNERLGLFPLDFLGKFPNDRLKTFTIEFLQKFSNDRLITFPLDVLAQFPAERIKTFPCEIQVKLGYSCNISSPTSTPAPTSTPVPGPNIVKVRYAENSSDLTNPNIRQEIAYHTGGVKQDITFADSTPGTKFIYAQFIDNKGQTTNANPFPFKIDLVGPTPTVSGFACELDLVNSSDLLFKFTGTNFGNTRGTVALRDGGSITPDGNWTDTAVTARLSSPPKSATTLGTQYFATLTNSNGQKSQEQQCLVGITQISLGGKLFCRAPRDFDQDNVELVLISDKDRNQKTSEKITIDKEGNITNIKTKLKAGDNYIACIKAPLSLRRCSAPFTASSGTNNLVINLPIGDYNGDGSINVVDGSLLSSQWGPMNSSKNCDVNRDGVCNSFEWSCLLHDFPSSNQSIP